MLVSFPRKGVTISRHATLRGARALPLVTVLLCSSLSFAATPTSTSYALRSNAVNNGVGDMASPTSRLSSSLGDTVYTFRGTSTGFVLNPGFWRATIGLTQGCVLDFDGSDMITPLTDGLLLLRAMLGLTSAAVTNGAIGAGAIGAGATRSTWVQSQPIIHLAAFDIDGNGATLPASDGIMLLRAIFALTGTAVTNGAVVGSRTWPEIRTYLNTNCGGNFAL